MGAYKYIQETFEKEVKERSPEFKERLMAMRREAPIIRLERPTNVLRARALGYKAKQGFIIARVKITKGARMTHRPTSRRMPKNMGTAKICAGKSKQSIAEERAARKFPNTEVLNSYWIAEDGQNKWFEVILVDPYHPAIKNDKDISWIVSTKHWNRAHRGLTSAGRKSRSLLCKGNGAEKIRPSLNAHDNQGK